MAKESTQIQDTATTLHTSASQEAILNIIFCNTDTVDEQTFSVYLTSGSEVPSVANMIVNSVTLTPKDTFVWETTEKMILETDDKVIAVATNNDKVTATVIYIGF